MHSCKLLILDWPLVVEELSVTANLSQMSLSEGSFEDDVENALHNRVLAVDEFRI